MFREAKIPQSRLLRQTSRLLLSWTIMAFAAGAKVNPGQPPQTSPSATDKLADTLTALRTGNLAEADIDLLVRTGAVQAIPDLKSSSRSLRIQGKKAGLQAQ